MLFLMVCFCLLTFWNALTKINKSNDLTRLLAKFVADEVYLEEDINNIQMSSDDNLLAKKKTQDLRLIHSFCF